MTFGAPYLLFGLLAVPLVAAGYWILERRRARRTSAWTRTALLPNMVRQLSLRRTRVPAVLLLIALVFLLVGFAKPQRVVDSARPGAPTIVLAFDVSGSMAAADVTPTRLAQARATAIRFLKLLPPNVRVAVVTFADRARLVEEPTLNRQEVIAELPTAVTPRGASAIGDGIRRSVAVAVGAAGQSERGSLNRPGAVLLFSDGVQTGGGTTIDGAVVSALVDYVPVNTVEIGTAHGVVRQLVTVDSVQLSTQIPVPVDPTALRAIAKQTSGTAFTADALATSASPLESVYANLNSYSTQRHDTRNLSALAAGFALAFVVAGVGLSGLWFGRVA